MNSTPGSSALQSIAEWPVDNAGAAIVSASGETIAAFGDSGRVYELASVTKLLVAHAVLVAVEEGAVELDTPAGPPGSTVRHLLAHASGLDFTTDEIRAAPGEQRIYSSTGYEVLADTVESATEIRFADYLAEAVCEPLGMTATALTGPAGHGAQSTVADLSRLAAELLSPRLISPELHAQQTSVQFPGIDGFVPGYGRQRPNDWGLGPELRDSKRPHWTGASNSPQTFGHFGQAGTFLWVDPVLCASCVVLTDRPFGAWAKPLWADFNDTVVTEIRTMNNIH
ncbi:serine hydrolase domain-containing protein [Jongsikchunia kroppenstedtii]|uniref:serine hydrolase domain-containing protein n=1 Tax=Jongsikchunia kroppenstedtii TaxID=1121721 RepID=UPI0003618205|nr:serine hydrolase domain-containing protein [Jongsikchunia kroppenstedtii]